MAAAKNKKRRKKKNKTAKKVAFIIAVVLSVLIAAAAIIIANWREIVQKAEDIMPSAFTYPTKYEEYVVKYSNEYKTDPVLVYAVIKTESGFDPKAESEVGARGLMQLMEEAFTWLKFRMDDKREINFDSMYDPQTNIQYGTYYLSFLMQHYDNNIELTAAAYHGGIGAVDGWIESGKIDKNNFDTSQIPETNDKTAEYVRRIRKAYNKYKEILKEKKIITQ